MNNECSNKEGEDVRVLEKVLVRPSAIKISQKVLMMGVLSSFSYKSNNVCSEEEEEEEKYVMVLGIPYLQMLQTDRRDGKGEPVIMSIQRGRRRWFKQTRTGGRRKKSG